MAKRKTTNEDQGGQLFRVTIKNGITHEYIYGVAATMEQAISRSMAVAVTDFGMNQPVVVAAERLGERHF